MGGALGTGLRYGISIWTAKLFGPELPYGTLAVNIIGSFLMGLIMYLSLRSELISPELRPILTTGIMGGFTTYSAFNYEILELIRNGNWSWGAGYFLTTSVLCLTAGLTGIAGSQWWVGK